MTPLSPSPNKRPNKHLSRNVTSDIPSKFKAEMEGHIGTEVKKERDNGDEDQGTPRSRKRNQAKKAKASTQSR